MGPRTLARSAAAGRALRACVASGLCAELLFPFAAIAAKNLRDAAHRLINSVTPNHFTTQRNTAQAEPPDPHRRIADEVSSAVRALRRIVPRDASTSILERLPDAICDAWNRAPLSHTGKPFIAHKTSSVCDAAAASRLRLSSPQWTTYSRAGLLRKAFYNNLAVELLMPFARMLPACGLTLFRSLWMDAMKLPAKFKAKIRAYLGRKHIQSLLCDTELCIGRLMLALEPIE